MINTNKQKKNIILFKYIINYKAYLNDINRVPLAKVLGVGSGKLVK